jgi:hypothetical protein
MAFEVVALAQTGAQVIVTAMAGEAWTQIRARIGRLFGGGDDQRQQRALEDLDETQAALNTASSEVQTREAQVELRALLKAWLRADPELAAQFADLIDEVAVQVNAAQPATTVIQRARADHGSTVVQAGRDANTGQLPPTGWPPSR